MISVVEFNREYFDRLIADQIEESGTLEYKAAAALDRSNEKKAEITKDISAFSNAGGGFLIYGIREFAEKEKRHLPERIDPVDQSQFSREWLDQITSQIQPRIDGLKIIPIHVGPGASDFVYVVEIPQSTTAHQARDLRYYKRRNFEVTAMEDYEIRDVMNRRKHPLLHVTVRVTRATKPGQKSLISIKVENVSRVIARYYCVTVYMPTKLSSRGIYIKGAICDPIDTLSCFSFSLDNGKRQPLFPSADVISHREFTPHVTHHPDLGPSIPDIRLTVYADEMERICLTKDLALAEKGWA